VTDGFGCTGTATYTLTQPTQLISGTPTFTNPICFGGATGTATVAPTGGSTPYSYAWSSSPPQTTPVAINLSARKYYVTITDDSLCHVIDSVTLTDPLPISFLDSVVVQPSCFGSNDGTAQTVPQNGTGTFTYLWDAYANNQTTNPAVGLAAGTYSVTVTDANGCTGTQSIPVGQPIAIIPATSPVNVTCFGYSNGSDTASATGGTPPYTFAWSNNTASATATNLGPNTYTVTVTDSKQCTATASSTITQPTAVRDTLLTSLRTNCPNSSDGTVSVLAAGGTGSMTYSIQDGSGTTLQTNTTGIFTGLSALQYTVISTDSNGCTYQDTITVPSPQLNTYTSYSDSTSCYGSQYKDGVIHVQGHTISNGPYRFSVDGSPLQFIPDFFDLAAGSHQVRAVDNYGCDTTFTVVVGTPLPASVQILPGDSTMTAGQSLQLSSVFGPYDSSAITSYYWSPASGLSCIDCPNPVVSPYNSQTTYTLVVTYNKGCTTSNVINISINGTPPVYVPNAFTPNGDGNNDLFYIYGVGIKDVNMSIFNRWGEKVYESTNQSNGWDGTYIGAQQPPGVYIYYIDITYLNGQKISRQGSLTLIR
jgi:gliding motility-associated-like protein